MQDLTSDPARLTFDEMQDVHPDSHDSLVLREANYPPVYYVPIQDVDMGQLAASTHHLLPLQG